MRYFIDPRHIFEFGRTHQCSSHSDGTPTEQWYAVTCMRRWAHTVKPSVFGLRRKLYNHCRCMDWSDANCPLTSAPRLSNSHNIYKDNCSSLNNIWMVCRTPKLTSVTTSAHVQQLHHSALTNTVQTFGCVDKDFAFCRNCQPYGLIRVKKTLK